LFFELHKKVLLENIKEEHLKVSKTARYFTYGEFSEKTKYLWFALHGYGMLATSMIKRFRVLNPEEHYVVAPEGLSRFYWHSPRKPVATWMTSEDRLNEIADYVAYLDQLYKLITTNKNLSNCKINALAFSQGTTTLARWIANQQSKADNLIFWAGSMLPHDADLSVTVPILNQSRVLYVTGDQDQWMTLETIEKYKKSLTEAGVNYEYIQFEGTHRVDEPTLVDVAKMLS